MVNAPEGLNMPRISGDAAASTCHVSLSLSLSPKCLYYDKYMRLPAMQTGPCGRAAAGSRGKIQNKSEKHGEITKFPCNGA